VLGVIGAVIAVTVVVVPVIVTVVVVPVIVTVVMVPVIVVVVPVIVAVVAVTVVVVPVIVVVVSRSQREKVGGKGEKPPTERGFQRPPCAIPAAVHPHMHISPRCRHRNRVPGHIYYSLTHPPCTE
jgi:multidrug efflux pump subunit AcrB